MAKHWNESKVFAALKGPFPDGAFVRIPHVRNGTGAQRRPRTADALIVSCWPSRGLWFAGVEIKVSLGDWRRELAKPDKAADIQKWCNYWYVAAPAGVIPLGELPPTWGLIECKGNGCKIVKAAPKLKAEPPSASFVAAVLRASIDAMVPRVELEDLVEARVEEKLRWTKEEGQRLREDIDKFEKATGVSVRYAWEHGNVAAALKLVKECKGAGVRDMAESLRRHAQTVIKAGCDAAAVCEQALADLDGPRG